jgi:hypothetical protein
MHGLRPRQRSRMPTPRCLPICGRPVQHAVVVAAYTFRETAREPGAISSAFSSPRTARSRLSDTRQRTWAPSAMRDYSMLKMFTHGTPAIRQVIARQCVLTLAQFVRDRVPQVF